MERNTQYDAVIVGAGFGGMGAAIQLEPAGPDNLAILEREDDLGGTWHVNRYPGLAVDIAVGHVLLLLRAEPVLVAAVRAGRRAQAVRRARRRQVRPAPAHALRRRRRGRPLGRGRAALGGVAAERRARRPARYLLTATGFLSQPQLPDIAGIDDVRRSRSCTPPRGTTAIDLTGSRAAIIGTGATAVQLIPEVARKARELTVYQRTPIWVAAEGRHSDPRCGATALRACAADAACGALRRATAILEGMMVTAVLHYRQAKLLNKGAAAASQASPARTGRATPICGAS